jgi:hypothetical protein
MSFNPDKTEIMVFSNTDFKIMFSMWIFHLASLDKVTPKCLWFVAIGIVFPLSEKLKLCPMSVLENTIISVLWNVLFSQT